MNRFQSSSAPVHRGARKSPAINQPNGQPGGRGGSRAPVVGVAGVTVLLMDDAGNVIDTAETVARGNYRFSSFDETGDYFIQLAASTDMEVISEETLDILVPNGSFRLRSLNFEVKI
jgi:peroxidase